ncbi:MAG: trypsin-like peptidase domain-containing protein [Betaproteobacteria bacterium]
MQKNFYQILRIKNDATAEQIGEAFYRARDRIAQSGVDDPDTQALLRDAHDTLIDADNRAAYDLSLRAPVATPPRLGSNPSPVPPFPAAESYGELQYTTGDNTSRRKWVGIIVAILAALLTIFIGLMMTGKSRTSSAPLAKKDTVNTSAIPVSSEPLSNSPAAPPGIQSSNLKPRTADELFSEVSASIVRVVSLDEMQRPISSGSGVVIGRNTVITNCHVVVKGPIVEVRTGKDSFPANITVADEAYDLCQLSVGNGFNAPAVEMGAMQYVRTGQKAFAIGAPQGLELTISEGLVSAIRESTMGKVIQTSAAISPGSSGGGLFNVNGQLIGITSFQMRTGQALNFAVPADWIGEMITRSGTGPALSAE